MRTNTAATLYNRYVVAGAEKYQRTPLVAVAWENRKASNVIRSGLIAADSVVVYVPLSLGANYLQPKAWQALVTKTGKWTLQVGDYIVKGAVADEIRAAQVGPPAVAAFTMSDLKAKYDDVVQVKSVDTMDMGSTSLQHWKVSAQ